MRIVFAAIFLTASIFPFLPVSPYTPEEAAAQTSDADPSWSNTSAGPPFTLPQWTDAAGWNAAAYYETIQLADIDGDKTDELLARGPNGMMIESWNTSVGIWESVSSSGPFDDASGWTKAEYYSTIQLADIDNDGKAELLGRSSVGLETYKWNGSGWDHLATGVPDFGDSEKWNQERHYSTIQTADIDSDGKAELLARGAKGLETYKWTGSTWSSIDSQNPAWTDDNGWEHHRFYSTIQTADIDGDGAAELLARGVGGMLTYKWSGSAWTSLKSDDPNWSDKEGWDKPPYYETIQTADINNDQKAELIGRSGTGIDTLGWDGSKWVYLSTKNPALTDDADWDKPQYYLTIQSADMNGDGSADLIARSATGIDTYSWTASGWSSQHTAEPQLANDYWNNDANYSTIQTGDVDGNGTADLLARGNYGIRTWIYDSSSATGWTRPTTYGFTPFTGDQATAYDFINTFLTLDSGDTVRGEYGSDSNTLSGYQGCLYNGSNDNNWVDWTELPTETCLALGGQTTISPPSGLTLADWNTVAEMVFGELGQAQSVADLYADLATLNGSVYEDGSQELGAIAQQLYNEDLAEQKVKALFENLFLLPLKLGPALGPQGSVVSGLLSAAISLGISATSSDSFEGKWSEVLTEYATYVQNNKDALNTTQAYVAGDYELMTFVAEKKSSGTWNPSDDWVTRYMTSEGRRGTALWVYQTLSPSLWYLDVFWYLNNSACSKPGDQDYQYYSNDNNGGDCYRQITQNSGGFPASKYLTTIMGAISTGPSGCTPTESNDVYWVYDSCNIGVARSDFFLNKDGWNFSTNSVCFGCPSAAPDMDAVLGDETNTISISETDHVHVMIYGQEDFDAGATVPSSLVFAGASALGWWADLDAWHDARVFDRNGDGFDDVLAAFPVDEMTELDESTTEATLTGMLTDGTTFSFTAPVNVINGPQ